MPLVRREEDRDKTGWIATARQKHDLRHGTWLGFGIVRNFGVVSGVEDASETKHGPGEQDENRPQDPRALARRRCVKFFQGVIRCRAANCAECGSPYSWIFMCCRAPSCAECGNTLLRSSSADTEEVPRLPDTRDSWTKKKKQPSSRASLATSWARHHREPRLVGGVRREQHRTRVHRERHQPTLLKDRTTGTRWNCG